MHAITRTRRPALLLIALALLAAVLLSLAPPGAGLAEASSKHRAKPTVVLVHGAFADGSGWNGVTERLQKRGYTVYATANPLRGLHSDAAYLRAFLDTLDGPIVLVGHSYGGAVITNAATGDDDVTALVYIAAYALDEGEALVGANALGGGHSDLADHIVLRPYPGAPQGDADGYIDPAFFHDIFAQDVPRREAAAMAAAQRPASRSSLVTPSGPPAWKSIPSWYQISAQDRVIPPEAQRAMAARAGATTVEIRSSHVSLISHPDTVTDVILDAATH